MSITFVRLSAPSHIKDKLDTVLQETGKSINEIVNIALEKYLTDEYGLIQPQTESNDFSNVDEFNDADDNEGLTDAIETNANDEKEDKQE